jgi:hypothetical protein
MDVEPLRIFDSLAHHQKIDVQISNITGHWLAARSGVGVAPLPSYIGNSDPHLFVYCQIPSKSGGCTC